MTLYLAALAADLTLGPPRPSEADVSIIIGRPERHRRPEPEMSEREHGAEKNFLPIEVGGDDGARAATALTVIPWRRAPRRARRNQERDPPAPRRLLPRAAHMDSGSPDFRPPVYWSWLFQSCAQIAHADRGRQGSSGAANAAHRMLGYVPFSRCISRLNRIKISLCLSLRLTANSTFRRLPLH